MKRNIHAKPFDEGTNVKLTLFREYIKNWLPVFLANQDPFRTTINIFDFFSGPGKTDHGDKGSPLIIIEEIKVYFQQIRSKSFKVNLYFNEFDKEKYESLKSNVTDLDYCKITIDNLDFSEAFKKMLPSMQGAANLILLDQGGIKQVNEDVLSRIVRLDATDFIMFISSSTLRRFSEHPAIKKYINIKNEEMTTREYVDTHRVVTEHFRTLVPQGKKYYLAPFSIKKGANIYGLIFGSGHLKGLEQFLSACWKVDPERGEANFDIDDDRISQSSPYLFPDMNRPKKVNLFEQDLKQRLENREFSTKSQIHEFALKMGFLKKHTTKLVRESEKGAKIKLS